MKRRSTAGCALLTVAAFLIGCETPDRAGASGQTAMLGAQLAGSQNPGARGDATVTVDRRANTAEWTVNYSGLSGPATMAHFHGPAAPGQNAPPVIWLSPRGEPVPPGTIKGKQQLTDEQMADLLGGRYYINVHTAANPGGEIRGQVMPR